MLFFRPPPLPRHPVARLLWVFIGLGLTAVLFVFGLFIAAVVLGVGVLVWLLRQINSALTRQPSVVVNQRPAQTSVIEGEFVVIERDRNPAA